MERLNIGDDVTISGTVVETKGDMLLMQTSAGWRHWVRPEEIHTWRPQGNNGGGRRAIVKES